MTLYVMQDATLWLSRRFLRTTHRLVSHYCREDCSTGHDAHVNRLHAACRNNGPCPQRMRRTDRREGASSTIRLYLCYYSLMLVAAGVRAAGQSAHSPGQMRFSWCSLPLLPLALALLIVCPAGQGAAARSVASRAAAGTFVNANGAPPSLAGLFYVCLPR